MKLRVAPTSDDRVTLNIEGNSLRLLITKNSVITRWAERRLEPALVREGLVTDPVAVGAQIGELFNQLSAPRKEVISSLTGLRAIPRLLTLPKIKASLLDDAVRREARKEMPLSLDTLYLSWQTVAEVGDQRQIYLLGVSRELLDSHVLAVQAAGIQLAAMDLKPLALVRAVNRKAAIIADLEDESLSIVLVIDGIPVIMRSFPLTAGSSDTGVRLEQLIGELVQTIRFYNEGHRSRPVPDTTPVYVTGSAMGDPKTVGMLSGVLDRPVEPPKSPLEHQPDLPVASFMANIGLAMKKV